MTGLGQGTTQFFERMLGPNDGNSEGKTLANRLHEIMDIYMRLNSLGIRDGVEAIDEFKRIANEFVKTGESSQGELEVAGTKYVLCYELTNKKHRRSTAILRHVGNSTA